MPRAKKKTLQIGDSLYWIQDGKPHGGQATAESLGTFRLKEELYLFLGDPVFYDLELFRAHYLHLLAFRRDGLLKDLAHVTNEIARAQQPDFGQPDKATY